MDSGYFSHVPLLAAALSVSPGPVLELGAGYGSTLMIHGLCGSLKRKVVTLESDESWMSKFMNYGRSWHTFRQVPDFLELPEHGMEWGLVFIDHGIAEQRGHSIRMLKDAPLIVVHDTCHPFLYDYEPTLSEFTYRFDYKVDGPMTTVVSNTIDVAKFFSGCCL